VKLAKMPQLIILNFYGNKIEHFDEDVFNDLRNLEMLAFVHNKIKVLPTKLLWKLNNLNEFLSFYNPIEAIPANFFKNNRKLAKVFMQFSKIKKINVNFRNLPNLKFVDLRENECIDDQVCSLCTLSIEYLQQKIDTQCGPKSEPLRCIFYYNKEDK
jgi:Leucine-rich repeat (LRR) protein